MNLELSAIVEIAPSITAAITALLVLLTRYREWVVSKKNDGPPAKADYDVAIESLHSDEFLRSLFEDLRKVALIKRNTGLYVVPEEIAALVSFMKKGRISPNEMKRAWAYKKFARDEAGAITKLTFELSMLDRVFLRLGNAYSLFLILLAIGCMVLSAVTQNFSPVFLALVFMACFLVSQLVMIRDLSVADRIERRMRE